MKAILDYILSIIYLVYFGLLLVIFHPLQWIAFNVFGPWAHQKIVQTMNGFFVYGFVLLASGARFSTNQKFEKNKRYLIVSNHQSMFDIIGIIWFLRKLNPIFVSKAELAKGIPSISYNLRHSGAALIDRKDKRQAVGAIIEMSKVATERNFTPVIFPEGTRSRNGQVKSFATTGIEILVKHYKPDYIVPILIRNTGKFNPTGFFPLRSFTTMFFEIMPIIKPSKNVAKDVKNLEESFKNAMSL